MSWYVPVYDWLVHAALVSLLILTAGSLAVLGCRQPVRRIRLIELTLIGCLLAPWMGMIPGYPRLSVCWWKVAGTDSAAATRTLASTQQLPADATPSAAHVESGPSAVAAGPTPSLIPSTEGASPLVREIHSWDGRLALVVAYGSGFVLIVGWRLLGTIALARVLRRTHPAPVSCRQQLRELAGRRGDPATLLSAEGVRQPFTFAWWRPVIVLPHELCSEGDRRVLRWCLAHEWSHVARRDTWSWMLGSAVGLLFFYQPLFWWLRRQLRICQDYVADAEAARHVAEPEDYAEFLTTRATAVTSRPVLAALGLGCTKSDLHRRVVMLVENPRPLERACPRLWKWSIALLAIVLVAAASAIQETPAASADIEQQAPGERQAEWVQSGPFQVTLPGGATIELVGVCEHPSTGRTWWKPDGDPLEAPPYERFAGTARPSEDQIAREIALRIRNGDEASIIWETEPAGHATAATAMDETERPGSRLHAKATTFPQSRRTVNLRIGFGLGQWQTHLETTPDDGDSATQFQYVDAEGKPRQGQVLAAPAAEREGGASLTLTHDLIDREVRVVALDLEGRPHNPTHTSSTGVPHVCQSTFRFRSLPLANVREFRFQSRPRGWIEFRNVSLHRGQRTDVTIVGKGEKRIHSTLGPNSAEVSSPKGQRVPAKSAPSGGVTGRLLALSLKPLAKQRILCYFGTPDEGVDKHHVETVSDQDGRFRIPELPPGSHCRIVLPGEPGKSFRVGPGFVASRTDAIDLGDVLERDFITSFGGNWAEDPVSGESLPQVPQSTADWQNAIAKAGAEFAKVYRLASDEDLKRFAPPYPPAREGYVRADYPSNSGPNWSQALTLLWHDGRLRSGSASIGGGAPVTRSVESLLESICGIYPQEIEGQRDLIRAQVEGDFVVRLGVPAEKLVSDLEKILVNECKLPVKLSLREEPREVIVVSGQYRFSPLAGHRQIEIYGKTLITDGTGGGGSGKFGAFLQWVGRFIDRRLVSDVKDPPNKELSWHYNRRYPMTPQTLQEDKDQMLVLEHLTEQTGLEFREETRNVRVLLVERR